ncbi:MAG: UDP-glucose 4-epimerase GalE [Candidatus Omnitrophota bacterium]
MKKTILVTGGAGYIGAHMARMLLETGHKVVIFDNLSTGIKPWIAKKARFVKGDLCSLPAIQRVFDKFHIDAAMHFAAKIVVPESMKEPVMYYRNNVGGTLNLLQAMRDHDARKIVFSSTAAVYGSPKHMPVTENEPTIPLSPYGASKLMSEKILADAAQAGGIEFIALRYFNVAGWDTRYKWPVKGRPEPTHLISNTMRALRGKGKLTVYGTDYKTSDGTGIRDFIHVLDLCQAHLLALSAFERGVENEVFNLGNGAGFSVLEVIETAAKTANCEVPYAVGPRRPGDVETVVASSEKAKTILGWQPEYDLEAILKSELERIV